MANSAGLITLRIPRPLRIQALPREKRVLCGGKESLEGPISSLRLEQQLQHQSKSFLSFILSASRMTSGWFSIGHLLGSECEGMLRD